MEGCVLVSFFKMIHIKYHTELPFNNTRFGNKSPRAKLPIVFKHNLHFNIQPSSKRSPILR